MYYAINVYYTTGREWYEQKGEIYMYRTCVQSVMACASDTCFAI